MISLPRLHFAQLPTPVESLPRLSAAMKAPHLWVKRDDQTGLAFGGNKTRKLELLIAEAQAHGAHTLITAGAAQSNHCRQTAAAAARFGFDCTLVLVGSQLSQLSGNLLLDHLFEAKIVWCNHSQREEVLKRTFNQAWEAGHRPYLIPYGGSSPTGAAGYALALQELLEQCSERDGPPLPDWIVFASSSGGTQAGLAAGALLLGYTGKILGISIDESATILQERVAVLAQQVADLLGEPQSIPASSILVNDNYLGQGYGVMGEAEREAIHLFAATEGLLLDPVYTGRAAAGLLDLVRQNFFSSGENVLFWHTGGTPALFAETYAKQL
jgi:D-cysteine desulfhydrase family pyridoxal phosphate-dependent enzyme